MKTFREYCEEKMRVLEMMGDPNDKIIVPPGDLDAWNKAKMDIASAANLKMNLPIGPQLKNKGKADAVLRAAEQDQNFKKIHNAKLSSIDGLRAAMSEPPKK